MDSDPNNPENNKSSNSQYDSNLNDHSKSLNENNLQVFQDEVSNYITDSDIDDPKYTPNTTSQNKELNKMSQNIQSKLRNIKAGTISKNINEFENENNLLRTELMKLQEALNAKDTVIQEFQHWAEITKDKFEQFEDANQTLKRQNEKLQQRINETDDIIKTQKIANERNEATAKSIGMYNEHINEWQNELQEKELKMNKKYFDREEQLKREFLKEINEWTRTKDELKVDNEKLKFEISNKQIEIETLNIKIDDLLYEAKLRGSKHDNDIKNLNEEIEDKDKLISSMEKEHQKEVISKDEEIMNLKDVNTNIVNESNEKNEKIYELQTQIEGISHNIDSLNNDINEYKQTVMNKDTIINQLKHQTEELIKEINNRDCELEQTEQNKQVEASEYNQHFNQLWKEKSEIEAQNAELVESWGIANESLKKINDLITDKYASIEMALYKETTKNENLEKKYKNIIKQLKCKTKAVEEENKSLRQAINERDLEREQIEYNRQNEIRNASLYNNISVMNNSMNQGYWRNNTTIENVAVNSSNNNISGWNIHGNNFSSGNYTNNGMNNYNIVYEDPKEESQKRTLEDFKRLWSKIDEKWDLPVKNI